MWLRNFKSQVALTSSKVDLSRSGSTNQHPPNTNTSHQTMTMTRTMRSLACAQVVGLVGLAAILIDHQSKHFVTAFSISNHGGRRVASRLSSTTISTSHLTSGSLFHLRRYRRLTRPFLCQSSNNGVTLIAPITILSAISPSDDDYIDAIVEEKTAGLAAASFLGDDDIIVEDVIPLVSELLTNKL